jgi:hypothetical protein
MALDLTQQIDLFLPKQEISPLKLAKLQGKKRQRASGQRSKKDEETPEEMEVITIKYQDDVVGAVSFDTEIGLGSFEYDPSFVKKGVELSPIKMPLSNRIYSFPELDFNTFKGLPGLIADSLPDDFGNAVLNAWVAGQGRSPSDIQHCLRQR